MITTLTINDRTDIVLRKFADKQNISYKEVINRALKNLISFMMNWKQKKYTS